MTLVYDRLKLQLTFQWPNEKPFHSCVFYVFAAVLKAHSNARAANVFRSMNSVIHVSDAKMEAMNRRTCAIRSVCQASSNGYTCKHDREAISTVHSSAVMDGAVQRPSFVLVEMDAVITAMNRIVACAVS